jgi:hypothetical protein
MPTPAATPYDDIPPDLNEPMREDEAPPDSGRPPGPSARRPLSPVPQAIRPSDRPTERASEPQNGPEAVDGSARRPVIDLAGHGREADDQDFVTSPLVGVQAVEQLLGGRVIEEREL